MASMSCAASVKPSAAKPFGIQRPLPGRLATSPQGHTSLSQVRNSQLQRQGTALPQQRTRRASKTAAAQELYQIADVGSFVGGTAATMFAMTLVGLAIGFVLLRFEALVEEGKI